MRPALLLCLALLLSVSYGNGQDNQKKAPDDSTVVAGTATKPKITPEKEAKIRRLLSLSGVQETVTTMMDGMEKSMRPMLAASLPDGEYREKLIGVFLQRFREKATVARMVDIAVPAYDKYFSDEELDAVIAFYETPIGRKALSVTPKIVAEVQETGRAMGSELGKASMTEVLDEHPELR